jgi:hypothetical protein
MDFSLILPLFPSYVVGEGLWVSTLAGKKILPSNCINPNLKVSLLGNQMLSASLICRGKQVTTMPLDKHQSEEIISLDKQQYEST